MQVDLPAALGVDLIHCERQAALAVESSNGSLQRIQGDLITVSYFDSLAVEINEMLKVCSAYKHRRHFASCVLQEFVFQSSLPLDGSCQDGSAALQESGVVSISNLARQFALAGDLLLSVITPRMGTLVQGRLESGLIFTPAYIARIKAQVTFLFLIAHLFVHTYVYIHDLYCCMNSMIKLLAPRKR